MRTVQKESGTVYLSKLAVAGVFRAAKCITGCVECISSENPINAELWPKTVAASTVLVMTAQAFLNLLENGPATLQTFDLMVSFLDHRIDYQWSHCRSFGWVLSIQTCGIALLQQDQNLWVLSNQVSTTI